MLPLNFLAIILSAVLSYAANFVWFMLLFRTAYAEGLGKTAEAMAKGPNAIQASIMQIIGNLVMATVLAWLMANLKYTGVSQGVLLAVIVWAGFVAAVLGPMYAFQAFSLQFFLITAGSVLLTFVITGAILGIWR